MTDCDIHICYESDSLASGRILFDILPETLKFKHTHVVRNGEAAGELELQVVLMVGGGSGTHPLEVGPWSWRVDAEGRVDHFFCRECANKFESDCGIHRHPSGNELESEDLVYLQDEADEQDLDLQAAIMLSLKERKDI